MFEYTTEDCKRYSLSVTLLYMLILYTKDNCIYCDKVKKAFSEHAIAYEERHISNPEYLKEVRTYGARTMPHLFDTTANIHVPESDEIIAYALEGSF